MQPLDRQFYSFFMVVLCGAFLGLLFDFLRVITRRLRLGLVASAAADLLFWAVATAALSGGLFYGNWGDPRLYVLVGLLIGIGLYYWLASPLVSWAFDLILRVADWLIRTAIRLFLRLIWEPLVWLVELLMAAFLALGRFLWRVLTVLGLLLYRPLRGPYRWCRLQYLLTIRKWRRLFRGRR